MISSTVVVACRGAKRWFDLDAVRTEHKLDDPYAHVKPDGTRYNRFKEGGRLGTDGEGLPSAGANNPAGAPPLDWHLDGHTSPGIQLAEPPPDGHVDDLALPKKIIDSMCPRSVCRVCGVARERVTDVTFEPHGERVDEPKGGSRGRLDDKLAAREQNAQSMVNGRATKNVETLGWTDCGHDDWRAGVVFDPFHNPAIEAACAELGRTYLTLEVDVETSTVVVACRGPKRWFDLNAVRTEHKEPDTLTKGRPATQNVGAPGHHTDPKNPADAMLANPAGAPPLDWHLDGHTTSPTYEPREGTQMLRYIVGDTRDVTATIDDNSVDLVFTSPPFLALRSYLAADHPDKHREIGSEANPAAFLDVLLELTAEWGRVLAPHGTLAVELGDTYSGNNEPGWTRTSGPEYDTEAKRRGGTASNGNRSATGWPLAKSLALIPQLYAIALAYGINPLTGQESPAGRWRVRNWIGWHRSNPPVGALADKWRPASSYITVACRGPKRWFDLDAVRTDLKVPDAAVTGVSYKGSGAERQPERGAQWHAANPDGKTIFSNAAGAPPLDWHTDGDLGVGHIILSTQPYAGSHYATFPMELPRKIIDCMCPRSVCRVCGVARERVVNDTSAFKPQAELAAHIKERREALGFSARDVDGWFGYKGMVHHWEDTTSQPSVPTSAAWPILKERLGLDDRFDAFCMGERRWTEFAGKYVNHNPNGRKSNLGTRADRIQPAERWTDCGHDNYRPGIVYDPFVGTGTTLAAAQDLGRDGIGVDIDPDNAWLARERVGMFCTFEDFPSSPEVEDVASPLL